MIVNVKVVEGERSRVQAYEGVCIGRSGGGLNENFTVRKISYGEGVERVFPLYSPMIDSIKVVRRGKVRRAKLYYLRGLRGKKARIAEATSTHRRRRRGSRRVSERPRHFATYREGSPLAAPFSCADCRPRCRGRHKRLYKRHGFQGSADHPRRPRAAALAVLRPAGGVRASRTLIA